MVYEMSIIKEWLYIIVPALALIVGILGYILNNKISKLDVSDLRIVLEYHPETGLGTSYLIRLYNRGRRTVSVQQVQLNFDSEKQIMYSELKRKYIHLTGKLPLALHETDSAEYLFPLYFMKGDIRSPLDLKHVQVFDTAGKKYSFPNKSFLSRIKFLKMRKQIQKDWSESAWL